jgi:hypothetical protein
MKAVEIFRSKRLFALKISEKIRLEAEKFINEKHYKGFRPVSDSFTLEGDYFKAFITTKKPNTY